MTVRTQHGIATGTLLVALSIGPCGNNLDRPLDDALDLDQSIMNHALDLGKGLGGLHPIVSDALEAFGKHMLHLCGAHNYVARLTQCKILPHFRGQTSPHS